MEKYQIKKSNSKKVFFVQKTCQKNWSRGGKKVWGF